MMSLVRARLARGKRHGAPVKSPNGSMGLAKNLLSVNGVLQRTSATSGLFHHAGNDVGVENFPCTVAMSEFRTCLARAVKRMLPV